MTSDPMTFEYLFDNTFDANLFGNSVVVNKKS